MARTGCFIAAATAALSCRPATQAGGPPATHQAGATAAAPAAPSNTINPPDSPYGPPGAVSNHFAYIPPQCYAKQKVAGKRARNPCYTCHTDSAPPNYVADGDLQVTRKLPLGALHNPWSNLFDPPSRRSANTSTEEVQRLVRASNYLVGGRLVLADALRSLPATWDGQGDGKWDGFVPDVWYRFDDQGFDLRPDGSPSGWRAFASYPLPGAFFPTNGAAGDVLIRLDPVLRQSAAGTPDARVHLANLAIVEALITRADVPIDPLDEREVGADLDLDGRLGVARRVVFRASRMHYAGKARVLEDAGQLPIAPGLFPVG